MNILLYSKDNGVTRKFHAAPLDGFTQKSLYSEALQPTPTRRGPVSPSQETA
jgi:hypothetical protein